MATATLTPSTGRRAILWVDDNPKNNSYFEQLLRERGIEVQLALSTDDGIQCFRSGRYGIVVSDMGREEDGQYHPDAGLDLLKKIRERDSQVPFLFYCSAQKAQEYREQALHLGATDIISSPTRVMGVLLEQLGALDV